MSDAEKALRALRRVREQGEESQQAGTFEPPTERIDEILGTARDMAKRYGILLPPPFSPFESLPKLPASRPENNDAVERMPKVKEIQEAAPKPEPKPEPTMICTRCGTPNNVAAVYCSRCGGFLKSRWEPDRGYIMRK